MEVCANAIFGISLFLCMLIAYVNVYILKHAIHEYIYQVQGRWLNRGCPTVTEQLRSQISGWQTPRHPHLPEKAKNA